MRIQASFAAVLLVWLCACQTEESSPDASPADSTLADSSGDVGGDLKSDTSPAPDQTAQDSAEADTRDPDLEGTPDSAPDNAPQCFEELLDYEDNDCDGAIDEDFRVTLYRRQGSNGVGYLGPDPDADHCFAFIQQGAPSCANGGNTEWAEYLHDESRIQLYANTIADGDTVEVGGHVLVRLGDCYRNSSSEHQYWTVDSQQYKALLDDPTWVCVKTTGYVRTGSPIGLDAAETAVRRHVNATATDTMYSVTAGEGADLGFTDMGVAWFAWAVPNGND